VGDSHGMYAIGWAPRPGDREPRLVILNGKTELPEARFRVYLSEDQGVTWIVTTPFTAALNQAAHAGPNLVQHPVFGLVGAFGQEVGRHQRPGATPSCAPLTEA